MFQRTGVITLALATLISFAAIQMTSAADPPTDRVVAMYFHRTQRCPTCKKMGSYTEDAIKTSFAKELTAKTVEFHFIDFQNKKNSKLTKAYKVTGPALIVARVSDNKVAEFKTLKDIWAKVSDKDAFYKYVESNVAAYGKNPK